MDKLAQEKAKKTKMRNQMLKEQKLTLIQELDSECDFMIKSAHKSVEHYPSKEEREWLVRGERIMEGFIDDPKVNLRKFEELYRLFVAKKIAFHTAKDIPIADPKEEELPS